jgi:hypothetical protein
MLAVTMLLINTPTLGIKISTCAVKTSEVSRTALARPEIHDKSNMVCPREALSETSVVWPAKLIAQAENFLGFHWSWHLPL